VWGDHLLPLLTCKEAARLACTCEALREVVRQHFMGIGMLKMKKLRAALTAFPRARELTLDCYPANWDEEDGEDEALVEWLREGGRGRHLTMMRVEGEMVTNLVHPALREGALPSLRSVDIYMTSETERASLTGGLLGGMTDLRLTLGVIHDLGPQLAALGLVRQLPALAKLELHLSAPPLQEAEDPAQWPPFIPPSLKTLSITLGDDLLSSSLLCALPGMLGASGAGLERLEIIFPFHFMKKGDDRLVHVAQALRCCSPTLKAFTFAPGGFVGIMEGTAEECEILEARLRVEWAELLAGVSACRELEVLRLPHAMVETLFPPGTAFDRLTHLEICDHEREHPPGAGMMGLWEVMASRGFPLLAELEVVLTSDWGGEEEVRTRVAPALGAVAGTLTRLHLTKSSPSEDGASMGVEEGMGYELGVALGKLRRLKDFTLSMSHDGRAYHALAQGLAASGGNRPLPLLWRVKVESSVASNADLLASLLLPSVRVFISSHYDHEAALLMASALRQAGYRHTWAPRLHCPFCPFNIQEAVRVIAQCRLDEARIVDFGPFDLVL
jgi:hypothetical protein